MYKIRNQSNRVIKYVPTISTGHAYLRVKGLDTYLENGQITIEKVTRLEILQDMLYYINSINLRTHSNYNLLYMRPYQVYSVNMETGLCIEFEFFRDTSLHHIVGNLSTDFDLEVGKIRLYKLLGGFKYYRWRKYFLRLSEDFIKLFAREIYQTEYQFHNLNLEKILYAIDHSTLRRETTIHAGSITHDI